MDDLIDVLGIREYFSATESECRVAALGHAQRQVSAQLAGRALSEESSARFETLYRTYAREACRLGVEDGIIQRYRAVYAEALSSEDLEAALGFLQSPQGQKFAQAGLDANRKVLPMIRRRQEGQALRASALLQTRLTSLLADLSLNGAGKDQGDAKTR